MPLLSACRKTLASPIYGGGGPVDSGKARSRRDGGVLPAFQRKAGISVYLQSKYTDSPRPSATPLINVGGKGLLVDPK